MACLFLLQSGVGFLHAVMAAETIQPPEENDMNIKTDLASLEPRNEFTRRDFVVTMLAVGFAAVVRPSAAVVSTIC
jgi:hypothetical protein